MAQPPENLRAWPRMGPSLLLAEKLTKLPLAELSFCFVMLALPLHVRRRGYNPGPLTYGPKAVPHFSYLVNVGIIQIDSKVKSHF